VMKKILLILLIASISMNWVSAETMNDTLADSFGTEALEDAVPSDAKRLIKGISPSSINDFAEGLQSILRGIAEDTVGVFYQNIIFSGRLFLSMIACQLFSVFSGSVGENAANYAGALSTCGLCLDKLQSMVSTQNGALGQMMDFMIVLNPVMSAACAASGSVSGAGINYALTVFFSDFILKLGNHLIIPAVYAYLALALADSLLRKERLKRLRELLGWATELLLKIVVYAFVGCLSVGGILTGATDSAKLKAAKMTIAGMLPVVGGIVSGAAETVLTGAAVLKTAIGTFGMLVIFATFLLPFLNLSFSWICVRITAALTGPLSVPLASLLESVFKAMGYLVALMGSSALICILSCCCYIKVIHL